MMRTLALLSVVVLGGSAPADNLVVRTFDGERLGQPHGFRFAALRQRTPGSWAIDGDDRNRYLVHEGSPAAAGGLALALLDGIAMQSPKLTVRLKLLDGDRTGGLVWRYHDAENCYLAALDLKDQEIALYRVVRGNRIRLEREDDLELDPDAWHTMTVVEQGGRIRVYLGGIRVFSVRDRFPDDGGGIGVWSAGNASSWFDDLGVEPARSRRP